MASYYNCSQVATVTQQLDVSLEQLDESVTDLHRVGDFMLLLCFYVTPLLIAFGLLGNSVAFSIFRHGMRRSASHFYFCVLSVADSCTLISVFLIGAWFRIYLPAWISSESLVQNATTNFSVAMAGGYQAVMIYAVRTLHESPGCSIWYFIRLTSQTASVWLLVVFTFTRLMVIRHPITGYRYTTVSSARCFVLVIVVLSAVMNVGVAIHDDCERRKGVDFDEILELTFVSLVPSVLLLTMNCMILSSVYRGHQISRQLRKDSVHEQARLDAEKHRLSGITQRLLAVSICFILLEAPSFAFRLYTIAREEARQLSPHVWISIDAALRFLSIVNYSVNVILYCITGKQFRAAFLSTLRCKSARNVIGSTVNNKYNNAYYLSATQTCSRTSTDIRLNLLRHENNHKYDSRRDNNGDYATLLPRRKTVNFVDLNLCARKSRSKRKNLHTSHDNLEGSAEEILALTARVRSQSI